MESRRLALWLRPIFKRMDAPIDWLIRVSDELLVSKYGGGCTLKLDELDDRVARLRKQVAFVEDLARDCHHEAQSAYLLVVAEAHVLKASAGNVNGPEGRQLSSAVRRCLDRLHLVRRRGFRVAGSGTLAPTRHFGQVRVMEPSPSPGSGKRR